MTTEPSNARKWVDDGTEEYQPIAEYIVLSTIRVNPQIEQNQLFLLLSTLMDRPRFNRAYKVVAQLRYQNLKIVVNRPNNKERRCYLSINPGLDFAKLMEHWYPQGSTMNFIPPIYVTRKR